MKNFPAIVFTGPAGSKDDNQKEEKTPNRNTRHDARTKEPNYREKIQQRRNYCARGLKPKTQHVEEMTRNETPLTMTSSITQQVEASQEVIVASVVSTVYPGAGTEAK